MGNRMLGNVKYQQETIQTGKFIGTVTDIATDVTEKVAMLSNIIMELMQKANPAFDTL